MCVGCVHSIKFLSEVKHSAVNGLNSDDIFKTKGKVSVYVDFKNNTDNSSIVPVVECPPQVPLELIVGTVRSDDSSESSLSHSFQEPRVEEVSRCSS